MFLYLSGRRRWGQRFVAGSDRHISASAAYVFDGRAVVEGHISNGLNVLAQCDFLQATAISKPYHRTVIGPKENAIGSIFIFSLPFLLHI